MAQPNFANMLKKSTTISAGDELRKIEGSKDGFEKFILHSEMTPCEFNEYEITEDKVNEIAESLKNRGLLQNLVVIPTDDPVHKYKILVGETRWHSIGKLLKEGDTRFEKGIRCLVIDKDTPEVDQKIIVEETNIKQREYDAKTRREAINRLTTLYSQKNQESGQNESITKKVAEVAGIGERQVQRYNAVTNKLIPELQKALDESKLSLEKAAKFASYPEDEQRLVLELLNMNSDLSKSEIEKIKQAAREKEQEYEEKLIQMNKENELIKNEKNKIEEKLLEKDIELEDLNKREEDLKNQIEEEMKNNDPSNEKIESLQAAMEKLLQEKESEETAKKTLEDQLTITGKELARAKKQLSQLQQETKAATSISLSDADKKRLSDSFELENILGDLKKQLNQFIVKSEKYKKNYQELTPEIITIYEDIKKRIHLDQQPD